MSAAESIRNADGTYRTAQSRVSETRLALNAAGVVAESCQNTHPRLQPLLREEQAGRKALFDAVLIAAKKGEDLGPDAAQIVEEYPELFGALPHEGVPQGHQSQAMRRERSRWVTGRNKLVAAVLKHLSRPIQTLDGARTDKRDSLPAHVREQAAKGARQ